MQLTFLTTELHKPRWVFDMFVCLVAASGLHLYMVWMTRGFKISPPDPQKLFEDILMIILAYTLSVFAGHIFMKKEWKSFIWVSIVGSILFPSIRIGLAIPGSIEYYYRFTLEGSLLSYLVSSFLGIFLFAVVAFAGVTLVASLLARVFISLFTRDRTEIQFPN